MLMFSGLIIWEDFDEMIDIIFGGIFRLIPKFGVGRDTKFPLAVTE